MISCSPAYFRARPACCCALATRLHDSVATCRGLVGPPGCRGRAPPDEWEIHRESGGHRPGLRSHSTERIPDPTGRGANGTAAARYIAGPGAGAGLLKPHRHQRINSTHEFAAIRVLNRLERVGETLRHALNSLAVFAPDWLRPQVPLTWFDGYGAWIGNDHLRTSTPPLRRLRRRSGPMVAGCCRRWRPRPTSPGSAVGFDPFSDESAVSLIRS